jgi:hypothetical protein
MNIHHQVKTILKRKVNYQNQKEVKEVIHLLGSGLNEKIFNLRFEEDNEKFNRRMNTDISLDHTQYIEADGFNIKVEEGNIYLEPKGEKGGGLFFTYEEHPVSRNIILQALTNPNFEI